MPCRVGTCTHTLNTPTNAKYTVIKHKNTHTHTNKQKWLTLERGDIGIETKIYLNKKLIRFESIWRDGVIIDHNIILGKNRKEEGMREREIEGGREGNGNKWEGRKVRLDKLESKDCATDYGICPFNCIIFLNDLCLVPIWSTFTRLHKRAFKNTKWIPALTSINPSTASHYPQNNVQVWQSRTLMTWPLHIPPTTFPTALPIIPSQHNYLYFHANTMSLLTSVSCSSYSL